MKLTFKLAWSFIIKSYKQSLLIILTIVTGIGAVVFIISLASSLKAMIKSFAGDNFPDLEVRRTIYEEPYFDIDEDFKAVMEDLPEVEKFIFIYIPGTITAKTQTNKKINSIYFIGFDDFDGFNYFNIEDSLVKGRFPDKANEVLIDDVVFTKEGLSLNDTFLFNSSRFTNVNVKIVGTFKTPTYAVNKNRAYFVFDDFVDKTGASAHLFFRFNKDVNIKELYETIITEELTNYYPGIEHYPLYWDDSIPFLEQIENSQTIFLIVMELFIGLVVFLLSSSLLVYLINKQSKSIGLLKALGYQQKEITLTFLIKTIILSFIATILGIILSHFGLNIFQAFMTDSDGSLILEVIKSFKLYLNAALIVFVIVLLATTLTLRKMKKASIIELIKRT